MTTACGAGTACIYDVMYYSVDDVGNTEVTKTAVNQARVDREAPVAPTGFTATDAQAGAGDQCDMSWNADASDGSGSGLDAASAFRVYYLLGAVAPACGAGTLGCTVGSAGTSCNITGLTESQLYTFRLCVYDSANPAPNVTSDGTSPCTPTSTPQPPSVVSGPTPSNNDSGTHVDSPFDLRTVFDDNGDAISGCEVCVATDGTCDTEWVGAALSGSGSATNCDASPTCSDGDSLTIQMRATNINGTTSTGTVSRTCDTAPPTGLSNQSPADGAPAVLLTALLVANAASDTGSGGVEYFFEIDTVNTFPAPEQSGWQGGTSFDPTLAGSTQYFWHVMAQDAVGNQTSFTTTWDFTTEAAANTAPNDPADHNQYKNNETTLIAPAGTTNETVVKIKATVSDPETDDVQLQVEMVNWNGGSPVFSGTPNCSRTYDGALYSNWVDFNGAGSLDVEIDTAGSAFYIDSCSDCHNFPPDDAPAQRDTPVGAVIGAHSVTEHEALVGNCNKCHVDDTPTDTEYDHRDGLIEMVAPIHSQTGSFYDRFPMDEAADNSFDQTNDLTGANLGNCASTYCHGTDSFRWRTAQLTNYDHCVICHGIELAGSGLANGAAAAINRAPGADPEDDGDGLGVDTAGDTGTLTDKVSDDPEVGAHNVHMLLPYAYTDELNSVDNCRECHKVPATVADADHNDSALPAEVFTTNAAQREKADLGPSALTPTYNDVTGECSNVYCHGADMPLGTPQTRVPVWSNTNFLTQTGAKTLAGDCDECHQAPPFAISDHTGLTDISECNACHVHFETDGTFANAANRALHINGVVDVSAECTSCHGTAKTVLYNTRQIVGAGGDFVRLSRHVSDGTSTEIVTSYDCSVCHAEGDVTKIIAGTGWTGTLHNDGATANTRMVHLRDVDDVGVGDGYWTFNKNIVDDAMRTDMDTFCMSCHDSDGASTIAVNGTVSGADIALTTSPTAGEALTPFNDDDTLENGRDGFTTRTRVIDVETQFFAGSGGSGSGYNGNPSQHAVLGARYSTTDADWPAAAWVNHTLRNGDTMNVVRETATLHCSDCHLSETNAHGAQNAWHMLLDGVANNFTNDTVMGGLRHDQNRDINVCYKCHNRNTYQDVDSANTRVWHSEDGDWDQADYGTGNSDEAYLGPPCLSCHSGDNFGNIHGVSGTYDPDNATWPITGTRYTRYRFMPGAWMRWSPGGGTSSTPAGDDTDWESFDTGGVGTCYFPPTTGSNWSNCTSHSGNPGTRDENSVPTRYNRLRRY
jgi:predicted CxxxxCH...CXXCH cytochrome family protein